MKDRKHDQHPDQKQKDPLSNEAGSIGLDQDEQAMNGDYGMPETEFENEQHKNQN